MIKLKIGVEENQNRKKMKVGKKEKMVSGGELDQNLCVQGRGPSPAGRGPWGQWRVLG